MCIFVCLFTFIRILQGSWEMGAKKTIYSHCERKLKQRIRQHIPVSIPQRETWGNMVFKTDIQFCTGNYFLAIGNYFHSFNKYLFSSNYVAWQAYILCVSHFLGGSANNAILSLCSLQFYPFLLKNRFYEVVIDLTKRKKQISHTQKIILQIKTQASIRKVIT